MRIVVNVHCTLVRYSCFVALWAYLLFIYLHLINLYEIHSYNISFYICVPLYYLFQLVKIFSRFVICFKSLAGDVC